VATHSVLPTCVPVLTYSSTPCHHTPCCTLHNNNNDNNNNNNKQVDYTNVPTIIFSHPPIGTVGLTEEEAVEKHGQDKIKVYKSKFTNLRYGPWKVDADKKPKTAMKLVCLGPEEKV
jgi:pyruvate/2-oxoglutarate dehydrogenase complex dihydrolipoamide dehydrogenase (E3) component